MTTFRMNVRKSPPEEAPRPPLGSFWAPLWAPVAHFYTSLGAPVAHRGPLAGLSAILRGSGVPQVAPGGTGADPLGLWEYCILASWMVLFPREFAHSSKVAAVRPSFSD